MNDLLDSLMTMMLTRETIQLMIQSQRIIKKEFGVRIDLDDKQAIYRFLAYANKSNSEELKTCTEKLLEQLVDEKAPHEKQSADQPTSKVRYYRGQPVNIPQTQVEEPAAEEPETKKTKQVIYRGQKVGC